MRKPSEPEESWSVLRDKIIGLGEHSARKSYYPELQQRLTELERFRTLLDQSNDAIFLIQVSDGRVIDVNVSACRQLGYTREELLSQTIDHIAGADRAMWLPAEPAQQANTHAEGKMFDTVLHRRNGQTLTVEVTIRRVVFQDMEYAVVVARDISERKQAEQQLTLVNFALNHVHEAAFLADQSAHFQYVNAEACQVLGYSHDELLGMTVTDIDPDFPLERWPDRWNQIKTHGSLMFESRHRTKDGHIFPVEITANYFEYDGQGYNLALVRDITDRKQMELALLEREQQYRTLVENIPDLIVRYGTNLQRIYVNPAWEKASGLLAQEVVNVDAADIPHVPRPINDVYIEKLRQAFETGESQTVEFTWANALGTTLFLSYILVPEFDPLGNVSSVLAVGRDLTERKRAEGVLRASEQLFRALVENSPDFIARYDREFRRIYVNPAIQKLFGSSADDVLGKTPADQSPVYAPQIYISHLRQVIETGTESAVEMPFRTMQGEMHWGHMRFVPELGPDGKVASVLAIGRDIHEIKENERRFRMLAENFPDFVMRFDRAGRSTYVNPAVEKAFGVPAEAFVGKTLQELPRRKPEQNAALLMQIHRAFDEGVANESEARWDTVTGERTFEIRLAPEKDATGNVVSVLSIARDITERKQAEEALRESERRLAEAQRIAHIGYWERNFEAGHIILSDEACHIFGLSPQEFPIELEQWHQRWLELIHPEDRSRTGQAAADALGDGPPYNVDYRVVRPSGEMRFIHSEASVRRDESGRPRYMLGMMQDITDRKRAETEILRLNRLYVVLSGINQTIVRTRDQQHMFDEACRVAVEVGHFRWVWIGRVDEAASAVRILAQYGYNQDRRQITLAEGDLENAEPTAMAIREGRIFLSNNLERDGALTPWRTEAIKRGYRSLAVLPLRVSDRVWGVIHFYAAEPAFFDEQEVTLLKELAADLSYAIESLQFDEQRRQAEEALRQAQKLESLGVLAGGVAHDFNNLLVAMLGQTSLALEQLPAESPVRDHIEKAVGAARRAADLTRQLLAYSGRGLFQVLPLNLNTLLQENLHLFEVAIPKNVHLVSNLAESLPFIDGDVGQMQQVVMNLIINAAEAIGRNLGTVRVTTDTYYITSMDAQLWKYIGSPLTPGLYVTLSVQDTGNGMDAATLSRVFDPFFTTKTTGRGLGLAAVLGIVRSHHGGLRVESELGRGTTFTLYFPVSSAQLQATITPDRKQASIEARGVVLVIDDEAPVREAVTDILEAQGLTVVTAHDGRTGLALYRERQAEIQLVLLDLSMPDLSGEETFHELRRINPAASIILSSGYQQSEVTHRFADQGVADFLQKPYDVDTLIQVIQQHLK